MDGIQLRNAGIAKAINNANAKSTNWAEEAYLKLLQYPANKFMTEELREWAHNTGLPVPPSARAWGAIITRAKREGVVIPLGFRSVKNPKAHATPATLWGRTKTAPIVYPFK